MLREPAKGRARRRALVVVLLVVVVMAMLGLATQAVALPGFNVIMNGIGPCDSCHPATAVHPPDNAVIPGTNTNHAAVGCATCHVNGTSEPPTPAACASCHTTGAIMTESPHINQGCSSTAGCHGVPNPAPAKITIAVKPKAIKFKKTVTVSGVLTPTSLTVARVALTVQRKVGSKWVQAKVGSAAVANSIASLKYSWKYKPSKKGSYRVQSSFFATAGASKTVSSWAPFSVK